EEEKEDLDPWDAFIDDLIGADRTPGGQQLGFDTEMLPPPVSAPAKKPSHTAPKSSKEDPPVSPAPRTSPPKPSPPPTPQPLAQKPRQSVPVPPPPPPRRSNPPAALVQVEETSQRPKIESRKTAPRLQGYRPDRDSLHTVHWLAVALALVTVFSAIPVVQHWNLAI